jgi:hypothetical protein
MHPLNGRRALLGLALMIGLPTLATAQAVSFQASNGQWMVAEGGGGGTVNANRNSPGAWETFTVEDFNGGDLYDGDQVAFRIGGLYLQAENGGGGAFRAVGGGPWAWETFTVVLLNGTDSRVDDGEVVALRSYNGHYVVAEGGGGGIVNCDRTGIGGWEQWTIRFGTPPAPPSSLTFIINGIESDGSDWAVPGKDFSNAVAATYGAIPGFWFWSSNSWYQVLPPYYSGIYSGAQELANFLHSLPPGDVNLIAHSHGGNVVLLSQIWSTRPIRRYITMATPVNWDWYEWRFALNYGIAGRCQASSEADFVQLWGASPYQVGNFVYNVYQSIQGAIEAFEALLNGNYQDSFYYFAQSAFNALQADYWLDTTRIEVEGPTYMFVSLGHSDVHTPGMWNAIAPYCR